MSHSLNNLKLYCAFEEDPLDSVPILRLDPAYEYGYRWATEPQPMIATDPKPASCMSLCYEAIKELDDNFSTEDVAQLLGGGGYDYRTISSAVSQLAFKLGLRRVDGVYSRISFATPVAITGAVSLKANKQSA